MTANWGCFFFSGSEGELDKYGYMDRPGQVF